MADRVKVYEEKNKKGLPIWAWLLPLLLLLALLGWFLLRPHAQPAVPVTPSATAAPQPAAAAANGFPDLGQVKFATDQATLTTEDQATLDRAAETMKNNPNVHLRMEGYTDSTGADPHNFTLSQKRAQAVADYLKSKGVDGNRLTGEGFGKSNPIDTNATDAGKADNRRVELFSQQQ
ncbi:OmpA family protein [Terriglobus sp.]|uniref:OmpA family protein n=1 Tax=Terriglobus sp. TaxID=1889013 RepID=UPI003B00F89A